MVSRQRFRVYYLHEHAILPIDCRFPSLRVHPPARVADVGNGAHHESAAEGCDTLVESTDPDPLDMSRDQVNMEGETVVVTRRVDPERRKSTVNGENRMLMEVVNPEPLTPSNVISDGLSNSISHID
jgi:hypothetical protein